MFNQIVARYKKYRKNTKARRMCYFLDEHLRNTGIKSDELKSQKEKYFDKISSLFVKIDYDSDYVIDFFNHQNSYKEAYENLKKVKEATELELNEYIDFTKVTKLLIKDEPIDDYLQLARDFKNYKLFEEEQGDFKQLLDLAKISRQSILKIVEVMIFTKNAGCALPQKKIVKYYDANRPDSEDLEILKQAWIFNYERIKKKHDFDITIEDLIQAVKYKRDPKTFVANVSRILDNEISIPYERFKNLDLEDQKITDLVSLLIKTKFANIFVDFDTVYNDLKILDVWQVIRFLVRFIDTGFNDFDYMKLRNYYFFGGDLEKLHRACLYNRQKEIFNNSVEFYETIVEITVVKNKTLNFDPLLFLVSVELAHNLTIIKLDENENINVLRPFIQIVKDDYMAGHDVFTVLNLLTLLKKNNIEIDFTTAKMIEKSSSNEDGNQLQKFKDIIYSALQPVLFEGESFMVTTKDNIEIKAFMMIEAVMNLKNFFTGADEKMLLKRASIIFIDEIQKKYNHDEIIINIEKISNNVLVRLLEETRENKPKYINHEQMNKVDNSEHQKHESQQTEHSSNNQKATENTHLEDEFDEKTMSNIKEEKFINSSKFNPRRVIIPKIEFVQKTFKEYDKEKEQFELHRQLEEAKIERIKADIEIKKAWAQSGDLKYLILKDNDEQDNVHH